ncbi:hypothetical protein MANES_02G084700v8 [Manihot esculenta]|uniref:Uncharacterized protein n=1 Tax=Manihot esculenta TaxID=3983 RepID=A0ACB7I712_MANES|nr:hypothetical protein MANES_02G084700v8 [Manihot esculenta]
MDEQQLCQPLLSTTVTITSSSSATPIITPALPNTGDDYYYVVESFSSHFGIILRLFTIFSIGVISIWANYEASKGFGITIINDISDFPAGKRFTLLYMSNDKATRLIQSSSSFVENILYPNISYPKKKVNHVTLRLSSSNLPKLVTVETSTNDESMALQGMSRIWLWDGKGKDKGPPWLLDGLVEYIKTVAGSGPMTALGAWELPEFGEFCLGDRDPRAVAKFLGQCERQSKGFIQRLNRGLKNEWDDRTVENALGTSVDNICHSFVNSVKW